MEKKEIELSSNIIILKYQGIKSLLLLMASQRVSIIILLPIWTKQLLVLLSRHN